MIKVVRWDKSLHSLWEEAKNVTGAIQDHGREASLVIECRASRRFGDDAMKSLER